MDGRGHVLWLVTVACRVSRERLQIRPHHIAHAADAGCLPQLVHRGPSLSPAVPQAFQSHVQAYLMAELEAVGHRLGRAVDLDPNAFDPMRFDAAGESRPRKADDAKRWIFFLRVPGVPVDAAVNG